MRIKVKVKPNSRINEVRLISENNFEVRVTSPPEKGKANEKTIQLLSEKLGIPKSFIKIISGENSRNKLIEILN